MKYSYFLYLIEIHLNEEIIAISLLVSSSSVFSGNNSGSGTWVYSESFAYNTYTDRQLCEVEWICIPDDLKNFNKKEILVSHSRTTTGKVSEVSSDLCLAFPPKQKCGWSKRP